LSSTPSRLGSRADSCRFGDPLRARSARKMAQAGGAILQDVSGRLRSGKRGVTMDVSLEGYSRQMRFYGLRRDGQRRVLDSHVAVWGRGALATVLANALLRGGVGHLRLVDRDFIETNNLQRQVLFDEHDVAENLPKAEAAARKLAAVNSSVHVEPVVTDIDRTNILDLVKDADLI